MIGEVTDRQQVDELLGSWPEHPKEVASMMLEKYGLPSEASPSMITWHNSGPWKRTVVYRDEIEHRFPKPHTDILEQYLDYQVPPDKVDDLAEFDGSVIVERTKGEISARCDMEAANFLALNLANDIVSGKRSVNDARDEYAREVKAKMQNEDAPYMQELMFTPPAGSTGDPDVTVLQQVG